MSKPHNSFENALTIINQTRLVSPRARQMLQEGSNQLSGSGEDFFEDAQTEFFRDVNNKLRAAEAETVTADLHIVLEILEPLLGILEESRIKETLPKYGRAVDLVLTKAYEKLTAWRCFEGWGQQSVELIHDPLLLLPLMQTDIAIRKCEGIINTISRFARREFLALIDPKKVYQETFRYDMLCFIAQTTLVKRGIHLSGIHFEDDIINIENKIITKSRVGSIIGIGGSEKVSKYKVTYQDMVVLVGGLLDDVIAYSHRVRGEINSGRSFIKTVHGWRGTQHLQPTASSSRFRTKGTNVIKRDKY